MNPKKIISSISIGAGAIIIGLGLQYALADWTSAPSNPPGGNVPAPINIGSSAQAKAGGLALGTATPPSGYTLDVESPGAYISALLTGGLTITGGNPSAGKVLESTNSNGLTTWVATSSLGIGGVTRVVGGTGITVTTSGGVVTVTCSGCSSGSGSGSGGSTVVGSYTNTWEAGRPTGLWQCTSHSGDATYASGSCYCGSGDTSVQSSYTAEESESYLCED